jgi:hypothetical protein
MTLENNGTVVRLSAGNWIAIVAIAVTVLGFLIPAYLNHDRLLMQVVANQDNISRRLDKIEDRLEAASPHPAAR